MTKKERTPTLATLHVLVSLNLTAPAVAPAADVQLDLAKLLDPNSAERVFLEERVALGVAKENLNVGLTCDNWLGVDSRAEPYGDLTVQPMELWSVFYPYPETEDEVFGGVFTSLKTAQAAVAARMSGHIESVLDMGKAFSDMEPDEMGLHMALILLASKNPAQVAEALDILRGGHSLLRHTFRIDPVVLDKAL